MQEAYLNLKAAQAELVEKERLERELELAAEMQRSLLPSVLPHYDDYRFAAYLAPARQVGGDLYGVQPLDDEHVALLIADVADKGMYAALLMAVTRTLFMQEAQRSLSPAVVALAVHRGLMTVGDGEDGYSMDAFVTAFYGVLHRPSGRLTYVRAAQEYLPGPSCAPPCAQVPLPGDLAASGMPPDLALDEQIVTLRPGDSLLLFSDGGVTDAHNVVDESYGLERLNASISWPAAWGRGDNGLNGPPISTNARGQGSGERRRDHRGGGGRRPGRGGAANPGWRGQRHHRSDPREPNRGDLCPGSGWGWVRW